VAINPTGKSDSIRRVERRAQRRRVHLLFFALLLIAAALYFFDLGRKDLGASEAYSALAATQPDPGAVIRTALRFDPGKPPLYHLFLHWFCAPFGSGEFSLRSFSAIWGLFHLLMLFVLGSELFGAETALVAAVLWAFNPLAVVLAQWARMYTMLIALALGQLAVLWRLRERPAPTAVAACGLAGAAMLYTHLGAILPVAAELAMLARDFYRGRRVAAPWIALGISLALFVPFIPAASEQFHGLLFGHWLDWIGTAGGASTTRKIAMAGAAAVILLGLVFGPAFKADALEPIRWCAGWLAIPILVLAAGSVLIRPMFEARYVAAAAPALALLIARGLEAFGPRVRNLAAAGFVTALLVMVPFYRGAQTENWREMARRIPAGGGPAEPIFFESGFFLSESSAAHDPQNGFPDGFFRVPFDYYFSGLNPRRAIDPFAPETSRDTIARAAFLTGGAWLISGRSDALARSEMPATQGLRIDLALKAGNTQLYHIVALPVPGSSRK
jgi:hypothetical protein